MTATSTERIAAAAAAPVAEGAPRVSVVVPVHDPGAYLDACIRSILGQSMSRGEFEAIFVDDGSTDGSGAVLDALAASEPNVRVIRIPASGAPGRPRNVGLDAARGDFVQFLDSDDELAPDALERLTAMAVRHSTDIVLGKFASASMPRRQDLFQRTRGRSTLVDTPGIVDGSLGPTKLFRTALLRHHGIRFPEGWRHMEDQHFTIHAYLRARSFSILGDAPCYFFTQRVDGTNISQERVDPATHLAHLAEIIDLVERETRPGELRDRIVRRFYRTEALARLTETTYLEQPPEYQAAMFDAVRDFASARIEPRLDAGLGLITGLRSALVRADRRDAVLELARRAAEIQLRAMWTQARWIGGALEVAFEAFLARGSGEPLVAVEQGGVLVLDPALTAGLVDAPVEIPASARSVRRTAIIRERASALEWFLPADTTAEFVPVAAVDGATSLRPTVRGAFTLDPTRVGSDLRPLAAGTWRVSIRLNALGFERAASVSRGDHPSAIVAEPALLTGGQVVVPRFDDDGGLAVEVAFGPPPLPDLVATAFTAAVTGRDIGLAAAPPRLELVLPVATDGDGRLDARLVVGGSSPPAAVPAVLRGRPAGVTLSADVSPLAVAVTDAPSPLRLELGAAIPGWTVATLRRAGRRIVLDGPVPVSRSRRVRDVVDWRAHRTAAEARVAGRRLGGVAEAAARRAFRALPASLRAPAAAAYRRVRG